MIEHCKRYKAIEAAIKKLQSLADEIQNARFPPGTIVKVISGTGTDLIECRVATYFGGLENADQVVVMPVAEDDRDKLRPYEQIRDIGFKVPISQMFDAQAASDYLRAIADIE